MSMASLLLEVQPMSHIGTWLSLSVYGDCPQLVKADAASPRCIRWSANRNLLSTPLIRYSLVGTAPHLGSGVPSAHVHKYGTLQAAVSPPRLAVTRCRRRQHAIRETEGDVDARPDGRSAATTSAHARRRALSRNLQPYPGEASELWNRAGLSQV